MSLYDIYANYWMCRYVKTMSVYLSHIKSMQWTMWSWPLMCMHSTLLAYVPEPNIPATLYCVSHFISSVTHIDAMVLHISIKNQVTSTSINQTTERYVPRTNMHLKCHIYPTYPNDLMCIYWGSMPMCMPCKKSLWSKLWSVRRATDRWKMARETDSLNCIS